MDTIPLLFTPQYLLPGSDQDQEDRLSLIPRAFQECPGVRLAYLNTSIQAAMNALNNQLNCMLLEGVLPEHPRPVHHLLSTKRRLGIDADQWITQYAICPKCWKHFTPAQVKELPSPECTVPDCEGVLYNEYTDAKGKHVRTSKKIMPHISLIGSLRQMFMRPDSQQDHPGQNEDEDYVMTDMHDSMMGILENRPHSSGPIYYAINDLPRDQQFLQVNVICAAIMPGPKEPNIVQINHCLEPSTHELMELKNGVKMDVYGEEELADVFTDNEALACDMPASHKCNGTAGHSHNFHPCAFCDIDIIKINTPEGYNNYHGVRFSILNVISGWLPSRKSALDFMHCIFLEIISHLFMCMLFGGYMLSGMGGVNSLKRHFEDIINAVRWPSHVTQLPKNLGENQSLKKADEWCHTEPPLPPNTIAPDFSHNHCSLYKAILFLCTGACTGQSFLAHYCLECLQLRIPLTINHQASMHTADMIKKFGPVYAWWLFTFERFNGMLERVHHNGHDGGRIELTLLWNWINHIIKVQAQDRGSMMMQIAVYQSEAAEDNVRLPLHNAKLINLHAYGLPQEVFYPILLQYCRSLWPNLHLVGDLLCDNGTPFYVNKVAHALTYIHKDGICYSCTMNWCMHADSFVFISQVSDDDIPPMPWDLYASTLGIHVSYTELGPQEVVPVSRIECPLALIPVHSNILKKDLWITVSFDHVSLQTARNEPEDYLEDEDGE
ncbi:hypothetical protein EDB19DRAFT_1899167 [Suillus lakei]|nr:hypothetical protein EDB19DRAFT_1899167 [Suillus lakei]